MVQRSRAAHPGDAAETISSPAAFCDESTQSLELAGSAAHETRQSSLPVQSNIGRYVLIAEVGRGGMGVVTRAYDPKLQREVALKAVRRDVLSAEAQRRLVREAQAMAKLSHPNVVAVYDVEVTDGDVVMAMEFVPGTTLGEWLAPVRSWREIVAVFVAAGRGLAAAHQASLMHRDFKPANVLVGNDGRVRVTDFGLARAHGATQSAPGAVGATRTTTRDADVTEAGTIVGTPRYMAPEQFDAFELGPAADQYAFCVALWEALTRQRLFEGLSEADLLAAKLEGPPPWPRGVDIPLLIQRALTRGLAGVPDERWPNMETLLEALAVQPVRRRAWLLAGGASSVVGMASVAWAGHEQALAQRCTGAQAQLADSWDPHRREAIAQVFSAANLPYAADMWDRVAPRLDSYAAAWASAYRETCEATTLRRERSVSVMDLQMGCLHRAKMDLRAVTEVLATADASVIERAAALAASLPDLQRCSDIEALTAETPPPAPSDADAVEAVRVALADVRALREGGKYSDALERMSAVARQAEAIPYRPLATEVDLELAASLDAAGHYELAQERFKLALRGALERKQWELAARAASRLVNTLGVTLVRPAEGLAFAETAKGLLELTTEAAKVDLLANIGSLHQTLGRYEDAETQYRAALAIVEQTWGADHFEVASYRGLLGTALRQQGRMEEAEIELRAQLSSQLATLGPQHPAVARARSDLGHTLSKLGRYSEAEAEHRLAVAIWDESVGSDHPHAAVARANLATTLAHQSREEEAEQEYRKALEAHRRAFGVAHIETAITQCNLADVLSGRGKHAEAEANLRECVSTAEKALGPNHLTVAELRGILVMTLLVQGRYLEAEEEARIEIAALLASVGPEHRATQLAYYQLATALRGRERYDEAEAVFRKIIAATPTIFGDGHPLIGRFLVGLARTLEAKGRLWEAEQVLRRALVLQSAALEPDHSEIVATRRWLGSTLRARKKLDEAEAQYREALALEQHARGTDHPYIAELQHGLAVTLATAGRKREARQLLEQAWKRWHDDARVTTQVRVELASTLARTLASAGDHTRATELKQVARTLVDERRE